MAGRRQAAGRRRLVGVGRHSHADASGWHDLEAEGIHSAVASANATAKVRVRAILTAPPSNDSTPPTLTVAEPLDGTTIVKADANVSVRVAGSAQDAGGVDSVAVAVDSGTPTAASPKAAWPGVRRVTVAATTPARWPSSLSVVSGLD